MNPINWYYLRNVFENTTKHNFKRMIMMAKDHIDKLYHASATDSAILLLYNSIQAVYEDFVKKYEAVQRIGQRKEMFAARLAKAMTEIPAVVEEWDYKIIEKYRPKTTEYQYLMNEGRTAFQRGGYELRLQVVSTFLEKLAEFPILSHVHSEVKTWYETTMQLRQLQQGLEGELGEAQSELETSRQALAKQMQYVWAGLIMHFIDDVQRVENFYELKYLQRGVEQSTAKEKQSPNEKRKRDFAEETSVSAELVDTEKTNINLDTPSAMPLSSNLSTNKNSTKPPTTLQISSGSNKMNNTFDLDTTAFGRQEFFQIVDSQTDRKPSKARYHLFTRF